MAAEKSDGFVVVWATLDRSAGRAGIKAFVVEAGTPGMYVTKVENKLGIRASDTATLVFEDCRVPLDNILGSPEVPKTSEGFKGVMATFDATLNDIFEGTQQINQLIVARRILGYSSKELS